MKKFNIITKIKLLIKCIYSEKTVSKRAKLNICEKEKSNQDLS